VKDKSRLSLLLCANLRAAPVPLPSALGLPNKKGFAPSDDRAMKPFLFLSNPQSPRFYASK
jgi:hypothetical protein